jgi:hypothetical protein
MSSTAQHTVHQQKENPYNIGSIDRALRYFIGGVLVGSVFYVNTGTMASVFGFEFALIKILPLIGIYPAITAWLGWDPVYALFNIRSASRLKYDVCDSLVEQTKAATKT